MTLLEVWPDYAPGPLWTDDGKPVYLALPEAGQPAFTWKPRWSRNSTMLGAESTDWLM